MTFMPLLLAAATLQAPVISAERIREDVRVLASDEFAGRGPGETGERKTIEFLGKAVGETPENAALHFKLGNAYEEARTYDQAKAQWRMVLDLEPDHPQRMRLLNLLAR